jgi:hypothetical protein
MARAAATRMRGLKDLGMRGPGGGLARDSNDDLAHPAGWE